MDYYKGPIIWDENMVSSLIYAAQIRPFELNAGDIDLILLDQLTVNRNLMVGADGNQFSQSEYLALRALRAANYVKKEDVVRHGITEFNEADIVVNDDTQFEVISEMSDNSGSKRLKKLEDKVLFTNTIDGIISASQAVKGKLDTKDYCERLVKNLFIIYAGTKSNAIAMGNSIRNHIIRRGAASKNSFTRISILRYDVASDLYHFVVGNGLNIRINTTLNFKEALVCKTSVKYDDISKYSYYLLRFRMAANSSTSCIVMQGGMIDDFIEKYHISVQI